MSSEESVQSRQNNELAALEAIYGDDLKDLRGKSAWNRWTPLNLSLSLNPQQGSSGVHEVYVRADLHVICNENYPNSVPKIKLERSKGLSKYALEELQRELEKRAEKLKGEEMIFQLSQHVQEFLHKHNKPGSKSFYHQMVQRQKEEEEKDQQAKVMEENRERQFIQEEVQRRQEMLKNESRLRREQRLNSDNSNDNDSRRLPSSNNSNEDSDDSLCDAHKKTVLIEFGNRQIKVGQCLKHCSFNHVVFIGMDVKTGETVLVGEWIIKTSKQQMAPLEQEFNNLTKLKHRNLAHYLNFKYDVESDERVIVHTLQDYINGPNCSFFTSDHFDLNIQFVRYVAKNVLTALDYLHRNNVVHRDIRAGYVHLSEKGAVYLGNYSLHRRLTDLSTSNQNRTYNKKSDIFKFGMFVVDLLGGSTLAFDVEPNIPSRAPPDLRDFLSKCFKREKLVSQLLNHSFLNQNLLRSLEYKDEENRNVSPDIAVQEETQVPQPSGLSRIDQEFSFIDNLGKGAFGDVFKVRNNLDDRYYAIKRIKLNPKNKQLNRKIIREVKLLSRLNHENIVRYYNSWTERTVIKNEDSSDLDSVANTATENSLKIARPNEFTLDDNIEKLAPPLRNVEVSITYDSKSQAAFIASSDDSSSDVENRWGVREVESDSDGIEFEQDDDAEYVEEASQKPSKSTHSSNSVVENGRQIEFMYIQMEFCEKSTLRNAIDNCLYLDESRVWRLFREIVEGLAHIHQQGMIHRDLKPVNIFLDSADHVKIGDFGLAVNITKPNDYDNRELFSAENSNVTGDSQTGLIGTLSYIAPELRETVKANYNQKVDIYSLGIIFFEMCYRSLPTNMERAMILSGLRKKDIVIPDDFPNNPKQKFLIGWLLEHDYTKRPTSQELLQSEHVPPPVLEERELRELVRHTLSNPQLKGYKYLIASCFDQTLTSAQDITYDKDPSAPTLNKQLQVYDYVKETIVKICKQHGAQNLSTFLLMPKSQYYEGVESCVKLMTHFGGIVSLPHDLRVPFARYVAWNGITFLRRYSIERVYRERKVFGFSPRELYECAFDIVNPSSGNLLADAEILYLVYEVIKELPGVKNKQVTIRLNHTSLIEAALLHYGIREKYQEVLQKISDFKDGKVSKSDLQTYFKILGLPESVTANTTNIFTSELEISKAWNYFHFILKKTNEASRLAKKALEDLQIIIQNAGDFGVTFEMKVALSTVHNIGQYSGMVCQFVCELKKKHKHENKEVLAAGGRYDTMIQSYRRMMEKAGMLGRDVRQSAVGVSICLDKLVQAVMRAQSEDLPKMEFLDVAVCSVGSKPLLQEKTKILRSLRSVGIRCAMIETTNNEEILEQCSELRVPHLVMLKDGEDGKVRVRSWERDRFQERTLERTDLLEHMQKIVRSCKDGGQETAPVVGVVSKSDVKGNFYEKNQSVVSVLFVTVDKLSATARKCYDLQIRSHLDDLFKKLSGYVTVLGVSCRSDVVRTIASYLEWGSDDQFHESLEIILKKHQRDEKYLNDVCDEILEQKRKKTKPVVILFSLSDSFHRLLI